MLVFAWGLQAAAGGAELPSVEAPYGLAWGPVTEVPRPTLVDREANITALIYFQGQAPALGRDTQEIILDVCRDEGLQRVIWFSRILADPERSDLYASILTEGIRRHGKPRPGPYLRSLLWPPGVMLGIRTASGWGEQIVMVSEGGGFARCSERHREQAGHPASDHVAELFGSASHRSTGAR